MRNKIYERWFSYWRSQQPFSPLYLHLTDLRQHLGEDLRWPCVHIPVSRLLGNTKIQNHRPKTIRWFNLPGKAEQAGKSDDSCTLHDAADSE